MKQNKNDIYTLIDEEYLSKFSFNHHAFMKDYGQFGYHFFPSLETIDLFTFFLYNDDNIVSFGSIPMSIVKI